MRTQLLSGAWLLLRVNVYFVYLDGYVQRVGSGAFTLGFGLEFGYVFLDTRIINGTHVCMDIQSIACNMDQSFSEIRRLILK